MNEAVATSELHTASWASPMRAWWAVAVFSLGAILSYTDRQILGLLVDPIRADLHISDTQVSLLQGLAFALIYSVAGLPLGRLADILPRRMVVLCGVLIWTAATVTCGLAHSFSALFVARLFVGVGEAALAPAAMSMITDLFPPQRRGTAIGVFVMGMVVGGGAALAIGGLLLQAARDGVLNGLPVVGHMAPWRATLLLLGLPGLFVALLLLTVPEPRRHHQGNAAAVSHYPIQQVVRALLERRAVVFPLLGAMGLYSVGDFSLPSWVPSLLSRNYHYSAGNIGASLGGITIVMGVLGTVLSGIVSDYASRSGGLRKRISIAAISATIALPTMFIGMTSNSWSVLVLFGWWVFFSSAAGTIGITSLQEVVPNETRGVIVAMVAFCNIMLGLGFGTMFTAMVTQNFFHDPLRVASSLSLVVGPAALIGLLLYWLAFRNTKQSISVA